MDSGRGTTEAPKCQYRLKRLRQIPPSTHPIGRPQCRSDRFCGRATDTWEENKWIEKITINAVAWWSCLTPGNTVAAEARKASEQKRMFPGNRTRRLFFLPPPTQTLNGCWHLQTPLQGNIHGEFQEGGRARIVGNNSLFGGFFSKVGTSGCIQLCQVEGSISFLHRTISTQTEQISNPLHPYNTRASFFRNLGKLRSGRRKL